MTKKMNVKWEKERKSAREIQIVGMYIQRKHSEETQKNASINHGKKPHYGFILSFGQYPQVWITEWEPGIQCVVFFVLPYTHTHKHTWHTSKKTTAAAIAIAHLTYSESRMYVAWLKWVWWVCMWSDFFSARFP